MSAAFREALAADRGDDASSLVFEPVGVVPTAPIGSIASVVAEATPAAGAVATRFASSAQANAAKRLIAVLLLASAIEPVTAIVDVPR